VTTTVKYTVIELQVAQVENEHFEVTMKVVYGLVMRKCRPPAFNIHGAHFALHLTLACIKPLFFTEEEPRGDE
jgi:hypothetical protein